MLLLLSLSLCYTGIYVAQEGMNDHISVLSCTAHRVTAMLCNDHVIHRVTHSESLSVESMPRFLHTTSLLWLFAGMFQLTHFTVIDTIYFGG